jgi:enoyl-CoA hydratase/carnithine racemase
MFDTIVYEVNDGVALIKLNRPGHHNAINSVMSRELPLAWSRFKNDPDAIVAIVTGEGEKAFCAGADISDFPVMDGKAGSATLASIRWTSLQNEIWKPVICAVNGLTVGGGLHFVADSDIVMASEQASFFDTHVRVGLVAGLEPVGLCRRMPMQAVLRMALVGGAERCSAQRAFELGMVGEVVPAESLIARARVVADMIKGNSPAAMAKTKEAIWQAADMGLADGLRNAWRLIMDHNTNHPDMAEGQKAFLEKRAPQWLRSTES